MKAILYILILANLGFFAWSTFFSDKPSKLGRVARSGPSLSLPSESDLKTSSFVDTQSGSSEDTPVAAQTQDLVRKKCWSLGPFTAAFDAEAAIANLNERGMMPIQRQAEQDVWVGYWVHLPAYPNFEEAETFGLSLRKEGVRDIYVEPHGELANTISLGVFKERERAYARIEQLSKKGIEAKLGNRYRLGTVFWLDFGEASTAPVTPADFPTKPGRILRLQAYGC